MTEEWFMLEAEGGPGNGPALMGNPYPNPESAETAAREFLAGGGRGPITVTRCTKEPLKRLDKEVTITETILTPGGAPESLA